MKPESISFEELMQECRLNDAVQFMRLLKNNGFQIKRGAAVPAKQAEEVVQRLQGRKLDWYHYRRQERNQNEGGPLRFATAADLQHIIGEYWKNFQSSRLHTSGMIGFVSIGGFLQSDTGAPFVLNVEDGINIFIGDRGSGKSTVLNLLGLLCPTTPSRTEVLMEKVRVLLRPEREADGERLRRVRTTMHEYGLTQYACFYYAAALPHCFLADLNSNTYALYYLHKNEEGSTPAWTPRAEKDLSSYLPDIQVLQQGEVFKIADKSNRYYLHGLFDVLFPELAQSRRQLAHAIKKLPLQKHASSAMLPSLPESKEEDLPGEDPDMLEDPDEFDQFIQERLEECRYFFRAARRGRMDEDCLDLLGYYVRRIRDIDWRTIPPLAQAFFAGDDALWHCFLGRMGRYLPRDLEVLLEWSKHDLAPAEDPPEEQEFTEGEPIEPSAERSSPQEEPLTPLEILQSLPRRFRGRIATLRRIKEKLSRLPEWSEPLHGLANSYGDILDGRASLIELQEKCCTQIKTIISQDNTAPVNVFTRASAKISAEARAEAQVMRRLHETAGFLIEALPTIDPHDFEPLLDEYLFSVERLLRRTESLASRAAEHTHEESWFYPAIEIELRQGSIYRPFEYLSFGQKSALILKIVLGSSQKSAFIIDQPEDNLDANSVTQILAPLLLKLGERRQIITATHNSNLVMNLTESLIVVMESRGETGRIAARGPLATSALTEKVLDVLEGGKEAFHYKMSMYGDFIQRLQGLIKDMDINLIESTFRKRTIDGLRNFLQPIICDRSMLDFLRHELRQRSRIGEHVRAARMALEGDDLLERIDSLLQTIDGDVTQLQSKIEEMRMLDTQPHRAIVHLGQILAKIQEEYQRRFSSGARDVVISYDPSLDRQMVYVDEGHLRLVLTNLIRNSLRATELQAAELLDLPTTFQERVEILLDRHTEKHLVLRYSDNGRGIPMEVRDKLYLVSCTDQKGQSHGLGGIIIRKILDLNGGSISILTSSPGSTVQEIHIPCHREAS